MEDTVRSVDVFSISSYDSWQWHSYMGRPSFHLNTIDFDQRGLVGFRRGWTEQATPEARQEAEETFLALLTCEAVSIGTLDFSSYMSYTDPYQHHCRSYDYMKACAIAASKNPRLQRIVISLYPDSIWTLDFANMLQFTGQKPVHLNVCPCPRHRRRDPGDRSYDDEIFDIQHLPRVAQCIQNCKNIASASVFGRLDTAQDFCETIFTALANRQSPTIRQLALGRRDIVNESSNTLDFALVTQLLTSKSCSALEKLRLDRLDFESMQIDSLLRGLTGNSSIHSLVINFQREISAFAEEVLHECLCRMSSLKELKLEGEPLPSFDFVINLFGSSLTLNTFDTYIFPKQAQYVDSLLTRAKSLQFLKLRISHGVDFHEMSTGLYYGLRSNRSLKSLEFPAWRGLDEETSPFHPFPDLDFAELAPFFLASRPNNDNYYLNLPKLEALTIGSLYGLGDDLFALLTQPNSSLKTISLYLSIDFNDQEVERLIEALRANNSLESVSILNESNSLDQSTTIATALARLALSSFEYLDLSDKHHFPDTFKRSFLAELRRNQLIENASLLGYYYQPWCPALQQEIDSICLDHVLQNQISRYHDRPQSLKTLPGIMETLKQKCPTSQTDQLDRVLSIYIMEHLLRLPGSEVVDGLSAFVCPSCYMDDLDSAIHTVKSLKDILDESSPTSHSNGQNWNFSSIAMGRTSDSVLESLDPLADDEGSTPIMDDLVENAKMVAMILNDGVFSEL